MRITISGKALFTLSFCGMLASCNFFGASESLKDAGKALLAASEQCVLEVRDKKMKYENAPSCTALSSRSSTSTLAALDQTLRSTPR